MLKAEEEERRWWICSPQRRKKEPLLLAESLPLSVVCDGGKRTERDAETLLRYLRRLDGAETLTECVRIHLTPHA